MKDFDYLLSEIPAPEDTIMNKPYFISMVDSGKIYRIIIRTVDLAVSLERYTSLYKRYPAFEWFQSEALFELTHCQPSLF